jgi:hypothetical protein
VSGIPASDSFGLAAQSGEEKGGNGEEREGDL